MEKILYEIIKQQNDFKELFQKIESILMLQKLNKSNHFNEITKFKLNELKSLYEQTENKNFEPKLIEELKCLIDEAEICYKHCKLLIHSFNESKIHEINKEDNDIIFISENDRKKFPISDFKSMLDQLESFSKIIDFNDTVLILRSVCNQIIKEEKYIENLISNDKIDSTVNLRKYLNYLDDLSVEFNPEKINCLTQKLYQLMWIESFERSIENPADLTIEKIKKLIDRAISNDLLTDKKIKNNSSKIQEAYSQLIELLSISQTWDKKAQNILESNSKFNLQYIEKTYLEASAIPVKLENLVKLEHIIKEANDLNKIIQTTNELRYPKFDHIVEILNQSEKICVSFDKIENLKLKVEFSREFFLKLNRLFLFEDNNITNTFNITSILTPRNDIRLIMEILHSKNERFDIVLSKTRTRNKIKNNDSKKIESLNSQDFTDDLYNQNFTTLKEKIKNLEMKELESIKELRSCNIQIYKMIESESTNENKIEIIKNDLKCCTCLKSILSALISDNYNTCRLCFGIFHKNNSCKFTTQYFINQKIIYCGNCKRSKRPHIDKVYENLISFERLEISSNENKALQMFFNRYTKWQENILKLFEKENLLQIKYKINNKSSGDCDIKKIYSDMDSFKKIDIKELYIESMLLETDSEYIQFILGFTDVIDIDFKFENIDLNKIFENFGKNKLKKLIQHDDDDKINVLDKQNNFKKSKKVCQKLETYDQSSANKTFQESNDILKRKKCIDIKKNQISNEKTESSDEDLFKSDNPNLFCSCRRRSFGQMICCDNNKCEIEWFHFECMKLKTKPKGKWYCPNCSK